MTMRRRKIWRFVGRSGFVVACISLVLIGIGSRWRFGFEERSFVVGVEHCFGFVGFGNFGPSHSWFEPGGHFVLAFQPVFIRGAVFFPLIDVALLGAVFGFIGSYCGRRKLPGFCPVCSYDLTGNVSGTCLECGTAVRGPPRGTRVASGPAPAGSSAPARSAPGFRGSTHRRRTT